MRVAFFAIITGLLPFIAIHASYLLAAHFGHVQWCVPYWDSCTSISATGRELPEKLLFKAIMMPAGLMAILFWWLVQQWLDQVLQRRTRLVPTLGVISGGFLIVYVAALGEGRDYQTLRKIGIVLFFSLTFLNQLLFLWHVSLANIIHRTPYTRVLQVQFWMAILLLSIGITSVALDIVYANYDAIDDAFEWVMMLLIVVQFVSHYCLWRKADLRLQISRGPV